MGCTVDNAVPGTAAYQGHVAEKVAHLRDIAADAGIEPVPDHRPVSDEMYALGQALAFDKILSGNKNISCMTCHHQTLGSGDGRHLPLGEGGFGLGSVRTGGAVIPRNSPPLFNLHVNETAFWDSRVFFQADQTFVSPAGDDLTDEMLTVFDFDVVSAQAMFPVTSREEMRGQPGTNELANLADNDFTGMWEALMARLGAIPEYVRLFEAAYPSTPFSQMTFAHAANAIASFEVAAFKSTGSPWERFLSGDDSAMSEKQVEGAIAFIETGCVHCHGGPGLSDFAHHNTARAQIGPGKGDNAALGGCDDFGRGRVTDLIPDKYAFRTPQLTNVQLTGPYGHAGQESDLERFIWHYTNPEEKLRGYELPAGAVNEGLMICENRQDVISTLDPWVGLLDFGPDPDKRVTSILQFLLALTDDNARHLEDVEPATVPSGLPVSDGPTPPPTDDGKDDGKDEDDQGEDDPTPPGEPMTCEERFGGEDHYMLCAENDDYCKFYVKTKGRTCRDVCESAGSTCLGGRHDKNNSCTSIGNTGCDTQAHDQICACAN